MPQKQSKSLNDLILSGAEGSKVSGGHHQADSLDRTKRDEAENLKP
jgi:hypothetical protein